ncbi:MAG TPA: hypothetical protein VIG88_11285 [Lysobacter sp.]
MRTMEWQRTATLHAVMACISTMAFAATSAIADPLYDAAFLPPAFRYIPNTRCYKNRFDVIECDSPGLRVAGDGRSCPPDGFFGSIAAEDGADLLDRFPEGDAHATARLQRGQFVCIAAQVNVRNADAAWSYVIAVPTGAIPACRGAVLCQNADRPVAWMGTPPTRPCRLDTTGIYTSGCATGRVRNERIDMYSMGINPIGE